MKENLSKKSSNFEPTRNFAKCPKLAREAPRAIQKIKKKIGPKRARAQFWAQGPCIFPFKSCNIVSAYGIGPLGPWTLGPLCRFRKSLGLRNAAQI